LGVLVAVKDRRILVTFEDANRLKGGVSDAERGAREIQSRFRVFVKGPTWFWSPLQ
jgi:hypothetical protein